MFDEPFRWTEAVSNRHGYVQGKLQKSQPVLAVPFNQGALLLAICPQPGKIYEVYDRIAMGGAGHPADVERLRMILLDMAHLEGFNRSERDVTLARLLQFGLAPALKQNFEEVQRAPYLAHLVLVEIDPNETTRFFKLNYDGHWETLNSGGIIGGPQKMADCIQKAINGKPFASYSLDQALREACAIWEEGRKQLEIEDLDESPTNLKDAFNQWIVEGAVLCRTTSRKSLYRTLTEDEIKMLKVDYLKS
tara:strand:+ start:2424 stop:3170 length:747 start_codon:yes stop_codon:yes gene_type:complete